MEIVASGKNGLLSLSILVVEFRDEFSDEVADDRRDLSDSETKEISRDRVTLGGRSTSGCRWRRWRGRGVMSGAVDVGDVVGEDLRRQISW